MYLQCKCLLGTSFLKKVFVLLSPQHPVLLTEAPLNPRRNREKSAEVSNKTKKKFC